MRKQSRSPGFGAHHGDQRPLWPERPCGFPIHRPEPADMFGPEVASLDADAIVRGFMAVLMPRNSDREEQARREQAATSAVRTWAMLDRFTRLHQNRPAVPDARRIVMERIREAAALQAFIDDGNDSPEARGALADRLKAARAALLDGYPGAEHHGFIAILDA